MENGEIYLKKEISKFDENFKPMDHRCTINANIRNSKKSILKCIIIKLLKANDEEETLNTS